MGRSIGIDFGGTNISACAFNDNGTIQVITTSTGDKTIPCSVLLKDDKVLVGTQAKLQGAEKNTTIFGLKSLLGKTVADIEELSKSFPLKFVSKNDKLQIQIPASSTDDKPKHVTPQLGVSAILSEVKVVAEEFLSEDVDSVVITVPNHFTDQQRQEMKDASFMAGLNTLRIINEQTAACMAYKLSEECEEECNLLVVDMGANWTTVSVIFMEDGIMETLRSKKIQFGGSDMDALLVNYCVKTMDSTHNYDASSDAKTVERLRILCEDAKKELTKKFQTIVHFHAEKVSDDGTVENINIELPIKRTKFQDLLRSRLSSLLEPCITSTLAEAGVEMGGLAEIVMSGGGAHVPLVQKCLSYYLEGKSPRFTINPDIVVAYGAALQASILSGQGERCLTKHNNLLGTLHLCDLKQHHGRGEVNIHITANIDANGVLHVTARESTSGIEATFINDDTKRISANEINRMISEAEQHQAEDKQVADRIDARNQLERYACRLKERVQSDREERIFTWLTKGKRQALINACEETFTWVYDHHKKAIKEDYEKRLVDLKELAGRSKVVVGEEKEEVGEEKWRMVEEVD